MTSLIQLALLLQFCAPAVTSVCVCYSMGPEFDPVETVENEVQDEMLHLVKPHSGKEDFYNRSTTAV